MDYKAAILSVLKLLENEGYSRDEIEQEVGASANWIDQVISRGGNKQALTRLENFHKAVAKRNTTNELQEPKAKYNRHQLLRLSLKEPKRAIPVTNGKASAGTIQLINDEPELILEFIDAPFIGIVDGVVECVGHSMYPVFPNGSRIAVKKLEDKTLIQPGEFYYLIDTNYEGYVKRIYVEDDGLVLSSENPDREKYPAFKRKWSQIVSLFKVKADITKH
jgi:phage repressor protein C with HTH and peptisase S24 domain